MTASSNLVPELGLILLTPLGRHFMLGPWVVGGVLLVTIMSVLVEPTAPPGSVEAADARSRAAATTTWSCQPMATHGGRVTAQQTRVYLARSFAVKWRLLWKDLGVGGLVPAFVPDAVR